jgi:hypothetical protein
MVIRILQSRLFFGVVFALALAAAIVNQHFVGS